MRRRGRKRPIIYVITQRLCLSALATAVLFAGCAADDKKSMPVVTHIKPTVRYELKRSLSKRLTEIPFDTERVKQATSPVAPRSPELKVPQSAQPDPVAQRAVIPSQMPSAMTNFEGNSNLDNQDAVGFGVMPPDTTGDVGPNHYIQWINLVFSVYDKNGTRVFGPAPGNLLWKDFGGGCEANNDGDVIVLYDQLADRWVFTQFALVADGHQCFAVSQTGDPLGAYHLYDFVVSPGGTNDYPKLGVWPDGYYLTFNDFTDSFRSAVTVAFDRNSMLAGQPAAAVSFAVQEPEGIETYFSLQPAHLEGWSVPPAGTPNTIVMAFDDEIWGEGNTPDEDSYKMWAFHADWSDPGSSTLTGPYTLATPDFDAELCDYSHSCIPQPDTSVGLDVLGQFTMYRAAYRQFEDHGALVVTHTVDVDGNSTAGVRWTEIRDPGKGAVLYQTGTFAPDDGNHRWMSSAAMDKDGNLAVGYSVSSGSTFPSVRYAGRLATDPLGVLAQGEKELVAGNASQTKGNRWGDYSSMSVDESDGCTFWYTQEYYADGSLRTRVGSFFFATCVSAEIGTIQGTVTSAEGGPIVGAKIQVGVQSTITDADGRYAIVVSAGTYDITASAITFEPQTTTGVVVENGATVEVSFTLDPAPVMEVEGFVHDSTAGWPLYAKIVLDSPDSPPIIAFSDPVTGYYWVELLSGFEYTMTVASQVPGYVDEVRPLVAGMGSGIANFALDVNVGTCNAPGYVRTTVDLLFEDFEGTFPPEGWTLENASTHCQSPGLPNWTDTDPEERSNLTGGTGKFAIADSDACASDSTMDASMISVPLDLSGFGRNEGLLISLQHDYRHLESSRADIDVWDQSAWVNVHRITGDSQRGPAYLEVGSSVGVGSSDVRVRFRYVAPGWYWWWEVDDIRIQKASCDYVGGGLIVGQVTDDNTGTPLPGAKIEVEGGETVYAISTPDDPNVGDGFYSAFVLGMRTLTVSKNGYGSVSYRVIPQFNGVEQVDFALPAGIVDVQPGQLYARVPLGGTTQDALTLSNIGGFAAGFSLMTIEGPPMTRPLGPFTPAGRRTGPKHLAALSAEHIRIPFDPVDVEPLNAGEVIDSFDTVTGAWGLGYQNRYNDLWVGSISALGGDDHLHRLLTDGTLTGETIDFSTYATVFAADMALNTRTGMLWQINVGGDNCVHEADPVAQVVTGNTICPPFGTSERGLAYDPITDTYFAGSWNDGAVRQFDGEGTIVRSVNVGLDIAGLAYNPTTGHLFALINHGGDTKDVFLLDAANDFAKLGSFNFSLDGASVFESYGQAGLAMDCQGNLWAVEQERGQLLVAKSGEQTSCGVGLPWLTVDPVEGIVEPDSTLPVTLTLDGGSLMPGQLQAQIMVNTDTPYSVPSVSIYFTVEFLDVDATHPDEPWVHALSGAGFRAGCGAGLFCPDDVLTRGLMSVWLLQGKLGVDHVPPQASGLVFDDVSSETVWADWIEEIASIGYVWGCGSGNFCPEGSILRKELAVFLLLTLEGTDYTPPSAEGFFDDVPGDLYMPWIDELARRGIATTCGGNNFCPDDVVTRSQMAVFAVQAFDLPIFIE